MKEKPPKTPKAPSKKTAMRLPADLHAELQEIADKSGHSMNVEIVARLQAMSGGATIASLQEQNKQIMAELKRTQDMIQEIITAIGPRR